MQTVQQINARGQLTCIPQFTPANKTVALTRSPLVAKRQLQRVIDFLEAELVAEQVLVEISADLVAMIALVTERLPEVRRNVPAHTHQGLASRVRVRLVDPVDRYIGKQRGFRRNAPGTNATGRRHEQPMVGSGDDAHEERRHPVHVAYGVIAFVPDGQELAGYAIGVFDVRPNGLLHFLVPYLRVPICRTVRRRSIRDPSVPRAPIPSR